MLSQCWRFDRNESVVNVLQQILLIDAILLLLPDLLMVIVFTFEPLQEQVKLLLIGHRCERERMSANQQGKQEMYWSTHWMILFAVNGQPEALLRIAIADLVGLPILAAAVWNAFRAKPKSSEG